MARSGPLLTEAQWKKIAPVLPKPPKHHQGWPPVDGESPCVGGDSVDSAQRGSLARSAEKYPHPSTCWRRLRDWDEQGVWLRIWRVFLSELNERQQLQWSESFLDGSFAPAKKGALKPEKPSGARARSGWWWSTAAEFLWGTTFVLPPSEVRFAETTLAAIRAGWRHRAGRPRQKPLRVIADRGYHSDALRQRLKRRGILLIAPHRSNRHRTPPQDGRILRRYQRRWTVQRTFAWLGNFRRLVVR